MHSFTRVLAFILLACALALVATTSVLAAEQRFVYGDSTNWYTYDASGGSQYGVPYVPSSYAYQDRYSYESRSTMYYPDGTSSFRYVSAPTRATRWSCIGSGCGKTPYVRPILDGYYQENNAVPRGYEYGYGASYGYPQVYGGPAVFQQW